MIVLDLYRLSHRDAPMAASYGPLATCEQWRDHRLQVLDRDGFSIDPIPCCGCCGVYQLGHGIDSITTWPNAATRCSRHHGRNCCAIEGCNRTRAAPLHNGEPVHADDQALCAEHWRRLVPPRSRVRRAYHAHFRRAAKLGWDADRIAAFERLWDAIIRMARRRATEGRIDEAEIHRLMGWDAP